MLRTVKENQTEVDAMRNHEFIKRIAALLMAALMLAGTTAACGGGNTAAETAAFRRDDNRTDRTEIYRNSRQSAR